MSRIHGRNGIFYLSATSGAAASPVAFLSGWGISWAQSYTDVTPLGAPARLWTSTVPDISGTFSGWYDDGTASSGGGYATTYATTYPFAYDPSLQAYTAAIDGLPRNFYLYPNTNTPSQYFQGVINVTEFDVTSGVTAGVAVTGSWNTSIAVTLVKNSGGVYNASYSATY